MKRTMLVSGGAGFIGVNTCAYFCRHGWDVMVLDDLSRPGSDVNLKWLTDNYRVIFENLDIRNSRDVQHVVGNHKPDVIIHLAAQVAVTTSVIDPRLDFEINATGTFNLLDAVRVYSPDTFFVNVSTNKLYGKMDDVDVVEKDERYEYGDLIHGIPETRRLDYYSPYGCSKGIADQYSIDFARIYDMSTVTLRQSCIYGPRQMGVEDQGWVAWFIIASMLGKRITIFGDGKQVRDVLHVNDLVACYARVIEMRDNISGQAFNVGGGPGNTLSLRELIEILRGHFDAAPLELCWTDWRPGDQKIFVSDIRKLSACTGWAPEISVQQGVNDLLCWVTGHRDMFAD